ncbi:hypothetical protein ACWF0M_25290 [Kribbella sp. NPDC055110]
MPVLPALVQRAQDAAIAVGKPLRREATGPACGAPDMGRFLAVLAAGSTGGRQARDVPGDRADPRLIGEARPGVGYDAAWMASAMPADCQCGAGEVGEGVW